MHGFRQEQRKNLARGRRPNVPEARNQLLLPHEFFLSFAGKLNEENRWVQLAQLIPWDLVEAHYSELFKPISKGGQACICQVKITPYVQPKLPHLKLGIV